jgi:hypothetical protein
MADDPNPIIQRRLKNIENRIARLAFLNAHLNKYKEDIGKIVEPTRAFEGVSLFYYYSLSQFILEINKLFSSDTEEYYSIPKLLNHIESNIKYVTWHKQKVTFPEITEEQYKSKKAIWNSGEKTEWQEVAKGDDLKKVKKIIGNQQNKIKENLEVITQVKLARDKVIAHLDKDFQKHNIKIPLELVEQLLQLSLEIFNELNLEINGASMYLDHIESSAISSLEPITKFYNLKKRIIDKKRTNEKHISVEELNEILN